MKDEDIADIKRIEEIAENMKCPHCRRGIQIKNRDCGRGYTQYWCVSCGYVESSNDHLFRSIEIRWLEKTVDGNKE